MHEYVPLQIRLPILLRLAALAFALLLSTLKSFGWCPPPGPTVACDFLNSDAVFVGKVISTRVVSTLGEEIDGWLYDVRVQELFRGPRTKTIEVFTENTSGRFPLEVGKQYLLFAAEFDGRLTIDCCGNSAELPEAQAAIRDLHGLKIPKDAAIEGRVSRSGMEERSKSGATGTAGSICTYHRGNIQQKPCRLLIGTSLCPIAPTIQGTLMRVKEDVPGCNSELTQSSNRRVLNSGVTP
jgi:hypothetical protein